MLRHRPTGRDRQVFLHQRRRGDPDIRERRPAGQGGEAEHQRRGGGEELCGRQTEREGDCAVPRQQQGNEDLQGERSGGCWREWRTIIFPVQDNKLTGPASLFSASGERIEFEYSDGVVHGPAKIKVKPVWS